MNKRYINCRAATLLKDKRTKSAFEEYALEVYSNWHTPPKWLCQDITDWDDNQYCQKLIVALRQESYRNYLSAQIKHAELEDKILGTHRAEKLRQQMNSGYCCLNNEIRANDKDARERPNYYVVDGNVYYRDEALELYKEFGDMLISLDWGGKKDLIKVPTANLARWLAAMKHILASEQLIRLYTEVEPNTIGAKGKYGVCPYCGELMLLDEGRDNICPICSHLVLRNKLVPESDQAQIQPLQAEVIDTYTEGDYTVTVLSTVTVEQDNQDPALYGATDYNNQWHDLDSCVSYDHLFRDTADEPTEFME